MAYSFTSQVDLVSDEDYHPKEFGRGRVTAPAGRSLRKEDRTGEGHDRREDQPSRDDSRRELLIDLLQC